MAHTTLTDDQILELHDVGCRPRARMELKIVNQLIASAAMADYVLKVREYEQDGETDYDVKSAVFNLDDAFVDVFDSTGEDLGWIRLVFGNDGYDLISDYTTNLEEFLRPCDELADRLENGKE